MIEVKCRAMRLWLLLCALLSSAAVAAPRKPVVLSGPPALTKWVGKELSKKYAPSNARGEVSALPTAKEVRDVTAPVRAVALVLCQAAGEYVTLQVLDGADGTPLDTISFKANLRKLPKAMARPQLAALTFALANGKAPARDAGAPVAQKPEPVNEPAKPEPKAEPSAQKPDASAAANEEPPTVTEAEPEERQPSSRPAVLASVGVGGFNRNFQWAGNPSPSLATGEQPFSGNIAVEASWFPGAHFTSNFLAHLGLYGSGDFGVGIVSRLDSSRFAHSATRLRFGWLVRFPIGERFTPYVHAGYARHEVTTSLVAVNDGSARPNLPDVLFNGFRGGLGFRVRVVGSFELDALGGFQLVAGKGELGSSRYFPRATAFAVDAGGGVSIGLGETLRLRAGVEWQRYFVTLNPDETSTFFARSAADQYITATANLQWVM